MISTKLTWRLSKEKLKQMSKEVLKGGVQDALEIVLQRANEKVPLDQSTLLKSGNTDVEVTSSKVGGTVYYDTPYAKRLHEHPEYNFQRGREGKWLEKTVNSSGKVLNQCLENRIKNTFGG